MLKRNDKCSCGSGKKYKNCCMNKLNKQDRALEMNDKALEKKKEKNDRNYRDAIIKLNECIEDLIVKNKDIAEHEKLARKNFFNEKNEDNFVANRFFASYFSYDYSIGRDLTPALYVINNYRFTNEERNIIYNCVRSYTSLFVIDKISGNEVIIKDLFTQKLYNTLDAKILGDFKVGDYIIARPVLIHGTYSLIDLTIRIQEDTKNVIYDNLVDAYLKNTGYTEIKKDIEVYVALNSLYFYLYMIQLLELSNYGGASTEETGDVEVVSDEEESDLVEEVSIDNSENSIANESKIEENTSSVENGLNSDDKVLEMVKSVVSDESELSEISGIWNKAVGSLKITGTENGWAAGLEYNFRKSKGESVTQNDIAKKYGVSSSTLAKRNKEISSVL